MDKSAHKESRLLRTETESIKGSILRASKVQTIKTSILLASSSESNIDAEEKMDRDQLLDALFDMCGGFSWF